MGSCGSESRDYPTEATSGTRQAHHQVKPARGVLCPLIGGNATHDAPIRQEQTVL
jgi:hypothetical protein